MKKLKYLAAVLIGIAGLGLQQATAADIIDNTPFVSILNASNGEAGSNFGTVTVTSLDVTTQTATITFQANIAGGFYFVDGNIVDVNLTGNSATLVAGSVTEVPKAGSVSDFSDVQYNAQVDGFGKFTVVLDNSSANNQEATITFQVTNTSNILWTSTSNVLAFNSQGWDAAAHYIDNNIAAPNTFFAAEGSGTIPDGGTTVMLLGIGLSVLGMARRFLRS
jgi:protein with PEP-CTERM/exosortase system signal